MSEPLFMFLAQGVASELASYRTGARHALMLYAKGANMDVARLVAIEGAVSNGWIFIDIKRAKEIHSNPLMIDNDVLRSAARDALESGSSLVVYKKELALDG